MIVKLKETDILKIVIETVVFCGYRELDLRNANDSGSLIFYFFLEISIS